MAGLLNAMPTQANRSNRIVAGDAISRTLRLWAQTSFAWGTSDCLLSVVRYVADVAGQPMPQWPRYSNGPAALRILRRHGGLEGYAGMVLERLGCTRTDWPERGDVGILDIPGTGPTTCLCLGSAWASRGQHGLVMITQAAEACWSVPVAAANSGEASSCRS